MEKVEEDAVTLLISLFHLLVIEIASGLGISISFQSDTISSLLTVQPSIRGPGQETTLRAQLFSDFFANPRQRPCPRHLKEAVRMEWQFSLRHWDLP
jgi:hypothetical protein